MASPSASAPTVAQELILKRYRPLRPLGSGGMGHVWLARDERNGLDVALKMVVREGRVAERAEREARAAAALRHPRCQRIYALARDSGHVRPHAFSSRSRRARSSSVARIASSWVLRSSSAAVPSACVIALTL